MPFVDTLWLSPGNLAAGDVLHAQSGDLVFEFDGDPILIGHRPGAPGQKPVMIGIDLDRFVAKPLDEYDDEDRKGAVLSGIELLVDPLSAVPTKSAQPGDLLTNGDIHAVAAESVQGGSVRIAIGMGMSNAPLIAYRAWQIRVAGAPIFFRLNIG